MFRLRPWGTRVHPSLKLRLTAGTDPRWCTGRPVPGTSPPSRSPFPPLSWTARTNWPTTPEEIFFKNAIINQTTLLKLPFLHKISICPLWCFSCFMNFFSGLLHYTCKKKKKKKKAPDYEQCKSYSNITQCDTLSGHHHHSLSQPACDQQITCCSRCHNAFSLLITKYSTLVLRRGQSLKFSEIAERMGFLKVHAVIF